MSNNFPAEAPEDIRRRFEEHGQGKVFRFWERLSSEERADLVHQAAQIDLTDLSTALTDLKPSVAENDADLSPAPIVALPENGGDPAEWTAAHEAGEVALASGQVAAFTVAGGQGTRLGFAGPKGQFKSTPLSRKSLFQLFAESIQATECRYGCKLWWFLMTSEANREATEEFFRKNNHFGLDRTRIRFFSQGMMPAIDDEGSIILQNPGSIALNPDGHGGSLKSLVASGATQTMHENGIDLISYFQVDNPLVHCLDPPFLGFHILRDSEMSSKTVPKSGPDEKVGHFCLCGGRLAVIEYSDLPDGLAIERNPDGNLLFGAASIAIHALDRKLVERLGGSADTVARLPYHGARKKVPTINDDGVPVIPTEPNAIKLETFVFDALPFAESPLVLETIREEEFAPIKNVEGVDSPRSSLQAQLKRARCWASSAGIELPDEIQLEIAPGFATSAKEFKCNWERRRPSAEQKLEKKEAILTKNDRD